MLYIWSKRGIKSLRFIYFARMGQRIRLLSVCERCRKGAWRKNLTHTQKQNNTTHTKIEEKKKNNSTEIESVLLLPLILFRATPLLLVFIVVLFEATCSAMGYVNQWFVYITRAHAYPNVYLCSPINPIITRPKRLWIHKYWIFGRTRAAQYEHTQHAHRHMFIPCSNR